MNNILILDNTFKKSSLINQAHNLFTYMYICNMFCESVSTMFYNLTRPAQL